jgi:hypothetical protein
MKSFGQQRVRAANHVGGRPLSSKGSLPLEPRVLAFEPPLALWGAGRLERSRGVDEELIVPPVVLRLADLMLGAELTDRPALRPSRSAVS